MKHFGVRLSHTQNDRVKSCYKVALQSNFMDIRIAIRKCNHGVSGFEKVQGRQRVFKKNNFLSGFKKDLKSWLGQTRILPRTLKQYPNGFSP